MSVPAPDFDGAWKETVEVFLPALLDLILPAVACQIDWSRGFEFLDSELRALFPKASSLSAVSQKGPPEVEMGVGQNHPP